MRTVFGVLLFAAAFGANAQAIYKCVGSNGAVSYQSSPCTAGAKVAKSINYTVAPAALSPRVPYVAQRPASSQYSSSSNYVSPSYDEKAQRKANCQYAKDDREATLDRVGLNRTFDLLRQLDDNVASACKGL
jgi:hypothetical protein